MRMLWSVLLLLLRKLVLPLRLILFLPIITWEGIRGEQKQIKSLALLILTRLTTKSFELSLSWIGIA